MKRLFIFAFCMLVSMGANAQSFKVETASGYETRIYVHQAKGEAKDITVVMLHGKSGSPGRSFYSGFYRKLRKAGYTVLAPKMPYSDFDGNYTQAIDVVDAAVDYAVKQGNRVVVAGHSMGATIALHYVGNHYRKEIIGFLPIALGHSPDVAMGLRNETIVSVMQAREMVKQGNGSKRKYFDDINAGKRKTIRMTAETYLSFYDPKIFPEMASVIPKIHVPVFWISGAQDRLRFVYEAEDNFNAIPANPKSMYREIKGSHLSVVSKSSKAVIDWLNTL